MLSTQFSNSTPHSGSSIEVSSDLLNYWQGHSHHRIALPFSPTTPISSCITFTLNQGNNSSVGKKAAWSRCAISLYKYQSLLSEGLHFSPLMYYCAAAHIINETRLIYLFIYLHIKSKLGSKFSLIIQKMTMAADQASAHMIKYYLVPACKLHSLSRRSF